MPCGYIEYHEDFLTAGRREVKEESGLEVRIKSVISIVSNFFTADIHTLVAVLLAEPAGGEVCAGDDVDRVGWFSLKDKLPEFAFEADSHIVQRYFATRFSGAPVDIRYAGAAPNRPS